jgi:hypothetical protein
LVTLFAVAMTAFAVGTSAGLAGARAAATQTYTLRAGDKVRVPSIQQVCTLAAEGGAPDLLCSRSSHPRHEVTIFRENILVWKVGNPDRPAWSGKP